MGRPTSTEKLVCVVLAVLAVLSPLYIDREPAEDEEDEEEGWGLLLPSALWLPGLLMVLILAINVACFVDRRVVRFDPYWIHRVGGSSCGLMATLLLLGFVLNCRVTASAATPPPSDGLCLGRRAISLAGVAAWLATASGQKSLEFEKPSLLQTVPSAVMDKGKAIADAYRTPSDGYEEGNGAELDPGLKQLQDIL
ncbi:hypothetical protein BRADI_1g72875v3 [Brachypodium distachyon]|uniref:Transmembrane protein n=1 Tax=Brachypodium distachyon TaxID=15368 RepID=A0A0Q3K0J7_BRADI|nr:hypothetical protein BRADI_1g72875v3 [Brachypodium distachyon]